jgi:predicted oxidoreductase (fatty acid repression mutant protein)
MLRTIFSVSFTIGSVIYFDNHQTIKLMQIMNTAAAAINKLPQYAASSATKSEVKLWMAPSILR